ncbi:MalY/PatB family protein [Paludibacter sp. 221]|uniref:MalY/PatB family protein n=1 Tax=Paludibacter sp. 221 TaxID=2302939 RepID=UPI001943A257|nr:PatB family C-S lyase [Paludibacter sp. 221]
MNYNFDEIIDRRNTDSYKYDKCKEVFGTDDILPMWVADMDFRTPQFVFDAIYRRCEHPVLGYTSISKDYFSVISAWINKQHQWQTEEEWMGFMPGIVPGLSFAVQAYTDADAEVIVQPPVYHPFMYSVQKNGRKLVYNPLKVADGRFEMDFDDLESKITPKTKLLLLCNPHNPGGCVWDKDTLVRLAEICAKHNIVVISDEIHADMALPGYKHIPFASVSETAKNIAVTYMAPSKTFNMPALIASYYVISNPELRDKLKRFLERNDVANGNVFAYEATKAVYLQGDEWRKQMLAYVQGNVDYMVDFLAKHVPQIKPMIPEASFLVFLNCKGLEMGGDDLQKFFVQNVKIGMNDGRMFGPGGEGYMRMNVACPRSTVEEAMNRIKNALS